jgi:hypothetical protein
MSRPFFPQNLVTDFIPKPDSILSAQEMDVERKHFRIELRENIRGRFLRITEAVAGRRNSVIVPDTGLDDFLAALKNVAAPGKPDETEKAAKPEKATKATKPKAAARTKAAAVPKA